MPIYIVTNMVQFRCDDLECQSNHMNIPKSKMWFTFIQIFKQSNNKNSLDGLLLVVCKLSND
jgi:hypothetical protein